MRTRLSYHKAEMSELDGVYSGQQDTYFTNGQLHACSAKGEINTGTEDDTFVVGLSAYSETTLVPVLGDEFDLQLALPGIFFSRWSRSLVIACPIIIHFPSLLRCSGLP